MKLQFNHHRNVIKKCENPLCENNLHLNYEPKGGITVCVESLSSWFVNSLEETDFFEKKVGKAYCSNKDLYNRKAGRELSLTRLKNTRLTVNKIIKYPMSSMTVRYVELIDSSGSRYKFRTEDDKGEARFIEYIPNLKGK